MFNKSILFKLTICVAIQIQVQPDKFEMLEKPLIEQSSTEKHALTLVPFDRDDH